MRCTPIFISLAALLAVAAPANAATGWSAPRSVGTTELKASNPQAAVDAEGRAVVAWERHSSGFNVIRAAAETSQGEFGETQTPSTSAETELQLAGVASDDAGDALVVWCSRIAGIRVVRVSARVAGGGFGGAQTISAAPVETCANVAINERGDAIVAWKSGGLVTFAVRDAGQPFRAAEVISNSSGIPNGVAPPAVAIDHSGAVRVAWASSLGATAGTFRVWQSTRQAGGPTQGGAPVTSELASSPSAPSTVVGLGPGGELAAVWTTRQTAPGTSAGFKDSPVMAAGSAAAGFGETVRLGPSLDTPPYLEAVQVRADPQGTAVAVRLGGLGELECPGLNQAAFASGLGAGAPSNRQSALIADDVTPSVGRSADGTSAFVWQNDGINQCGQADEPGPAKVSAAMFGPNGSGSAPISISDPRYPSYDPAATSGARIGAAWICFDGRKTRVQVATYGSNPGEPLWCGAEDLDPPKVKVKTTRYPLRWRSTSRPSPRASCHEQCTVTVGLLLFSRGHRAAKLGVSEQVLKPNKAKRLDFPKLGRGERRLVARAVRRRSNVRLIYRLRFDDLAANSVLKTARVRLY